ncbi:MAG TPA: hypothetical protein VNJ28_00730, partial [Candidatus Limnocylindrales bacterium]|nr:hypothetical protein [Candidatus Limnocylindrales bacterium]
FEAVARLTEEAEAAVLGDVAASPAYRGSVVAALLGTAAHEYEEAVGGGAIRELVEYQDAYGFAGEARRLYAAIEAAVRAASDEEADEIEEAFGVLAEALPGPTPPGTLVPVERVEEAAALVGHELEETVGARPLQEADLEAVASEIRHLLDEIVAAYRAGDAERAAELAAEAYLENYEVIEASVIEAAPDVNAELEPLLGAELRRRIGAGAPVEEIERMVARAKELLDRAVEAVEGS